MAFGRWHWTALLAVAALALWLLLGSGRVFGVDLGALGMTLLVATSGVALYGLSTVRAGEAERRVSPAEWKAWIGLGFMAVAMAYFMLRMPVFGQDALAASQAPGVLRNLVLLLVAWIVLSQVLAARWKGRVLEDERDRVIEARSVEWGRAALVFVVIGLAVLFAFSPPERLLWATPAMVGKLLVFALLWGWVVEHVAMVSMYWRDRR